MAKRGWDEPPRPEDARYRSLDLWRGVACLLVVVFHSTLYVTTPEAPLPADAALVDLVVKVTHRLWAGVPMFFVISGYCISAASDATRSARASVGSYFFRRFRRIYPPYWVLFFGSAAVAVVAAWSAAPSGPGLHGVLDPRSLTAWQWAGNLSLTESWRHHLLGGAPLYLLGHAWTLAYEEQFYAVLGLLLILPRRHFYPAAAAVTALTLVLFSAKLGWLPSLPINGFFFDGRWLLFAAGIAVYFFVNDAGGWGRRGVVAVLVLAGAWAARSPEKLLAVKANFYQELFVASAFALLLCALHPYDAKVSAFRPLMRLGKLCYSLYLVHVPVVALWAPWTASVLPQGSWALLGFGVPTSVGLSIAVAAVFHRWVEKRFLNPPQAQSA